MIVEGFGGPGGWSEGLRLLGSDRDAVAIELDESACATRAAAGHATIRADAATFPLGHVGPVEGFIGSPPCPTFSQAGKREGIGDMPRLHAHAHRCLTGWQQPENHWSDPRTPLVLEPLRYAHELVPQWIALEQVPDVLVLWETFARVFRAWGYRVWTGVLNAADYGVPQTRERAFLLAHRRKLPLPPEPTHVRGGSVTMFGELAPWVSMAEALGWPEFSRSRSDGGALDSSQPSPVVCGHREPAFMFPRVGFPRLDDRGDSPDGYRERDMRAADEPAFALTEKARSWVIQTGANTMKHGREAEDIEPYERSLDEPAPTLDQKVGTAWRVLNTGRDWKPGGTRDDAQKVEATEPAPLLTAKSGGQWIFERPVTTVCGDSRLWPPGHKENANDPPGKYQQRRGEDAIRLTIADALVLQSFRPDYPVQGNKTEQFRQVGNAVPPLLAARVLEGLLS